MRLTSPVRFWPLVAVLLAPMAGAPPAHAEGRCPPGFFPTGGDQPGQENAGWLGCAPMGPMEEEPMEDEPMEDGGGYGDSLPPVHFSPEQWRDWAEDARKAEEALDAERMQDPVYRKLKEGFWDDANSDPGDPRQICLAAFLTLRGGVLLMDWAGDYRGTFLAFFGAAIPRATTIQQTRVSLTQSGETQTVQAFHAPLPWAAEIGMIMFAVPSTEALLGSIENVQDFDVKIAGQSVAWGEWHDGQQARDRLRACVNARARR